MDFFRTDTDLKSGVTIHVKNANIGRSKYLAIIPQQKSNV